jgi:malate dehydrogenase (oxaloacetate-decarboxylating)
MEGKCALFKTFADVDAFPICLSTQDTDEIVRTVAAIAPSFGGINLEDISAPRCFEVEKRLIEMLDIPVFHDDQHGTAVVTLAALINSLKLVGKRPEDIKIVMQGAGSAGVAVTKLLLSYGVPNVIMIDRKGIIYEGRADLNESKVEIAGITNRDALKGSAKDAFSGADVFIGVSQGNTVTEEMIRLMNKDAIVFAMANPTPEISPEAAKLAGARVIGTGRSDYPNQINNVLAFPGIFKGALSVRASRISEGMKVAAAYAIASCVDAAELCEDYIIPNPFDKKIAEKVSQAVASTAKREGLNRI